MRTEREIRDKLETLREKKGETPSRMEKNSYEAAIRSLKWMLQEDIDWHVLEE